MQPEIHLFGLTIYTFGLLFALIVGGLVWLSRLRGGRAATGRPTPGRERSTVPDAP
jgi:hypothetical protein